MKTNKAFTLIELLVVVLIIGILASIAVPQYKFSVQKSKYLQAVVLADNVWKAQQVYHLANGSYTDNINNLDISLPLYRKKYGNANFFYDWGWCSINNYSTRQTFCKINDNYYLRSYSDNIRICVAETDEADKFCIKLGGKYIYNSGNGNNYYQLPDSFL